MRQSQCQKKPSRVNILYTGAWKKELLPWQGTFRHCQNVGNTHLYLKANVCAKSHSNQWKHSETITINVRKKPRVNILYTDAWTKGPLPWQCTFRHCQKVCRSHLHLKANMCAKSQWNPCKDIQTITRNVCVARAYLWNIFPPCNGPTTRPYFAKCVMRQRILCFITGS